MVDLSGIQQKLNPDNDAGGHYVRNSGAVVRGPGALSHHAVLGKDTGPDGTSLVDATGEIVTEDVLAVKAAGLLADGEPRPIVTLIDFPQMVSTKHPNGKELYERDVNCLIKFFSNKLNCVSGNGDEDMKAGWRWEDVTGEGGGVGEEGGGGGFKVCWWGGDRRRWLDWLRLEVVRLKRRKERSREVQSRRREFVRRQV